jgi:GNAT superfamily N-acetyltransferase
MRAEVAVRRATADDASAIAGVLYDSFVEFRALYTAGGFAATALGCGQILARMEEGPVWVALCENAIVGTVAAVRKDSSAYIRGMAVVPAARSSGVGAELLRQAEAWAVSEGFRRIFLSTTPFLDSAIRLYEKFGFRRKRDGAHDLFGTPLFTMERNLPGGHFRNRG